MRLEKMIDRDELVRELKQRRHLLLPIFHGQRPEVVSSSVQGHESYNYQVGAYWMVDGIIKQLEALT